MSEIYITIVQRHTNVQKLIYHSTVHVLHTNTHNTLRMVCLCSKCSKIHLHCTISSPLIPGRSMEAASLIPIPLRMTLSEPSRPWPEQETICSPREMLVWHKQLYMCLECIPTLPPANNPTTTPSFPLSPSSLLPPSPLPPPSSPPPSSLLHPSSLHPSFLLPPSSLHPTHQVLSLFVQVHYTHVHDGSDVGEGLHDLHIATILISCCAQLQKCKNTS